VSGGTSSKKKHLDGRNFFCNKRKKKEGGRGGKGKKRHLKRQKKIKVEADEMAEREGRTVGL